MTENPFSLEQSLFNYKIVDKDGTLRPLSLNVFQKALHKIVVKIEGDGLPVRIIVLKPRQTGLSTYCQSYVYNKTTTNFYTNSMVIADDVDNTNNLFKMSKRFWDYSHPSLRPMRKNSNEKALVFGNPDSKGEDKGLESALYLETAGKMTAGRGGTTRHIHCSEFAFWPKAAQTVSGLFQAVPARPGTTIFIESTANGMAGIGEEFYKRWMKAKAGEKEGSGPRFIPVFFPWYWNPEYEMEPPDDFILDKEEEKIQRRNPLITDRKLCWRRYKIQNELGSANLDPKDQFSQEYPETETEAFLASGRPVFQMQKIMDHIARLESRPFKKGIFDPNGKFYERSDGPYRLYTPYRQGGIYAIGADVAEGLATGDYSTMAVINRELEYVASYHSHIAPDLFGQEMMKIGTHFSAKEEDGVKCLLAPEMNNHGHAVLAVIKQEWSNIFTRQIEEERADEFTQKIGWHSNRKTKIKMLDDFVAAYREDSIKIYDIELLREMMSLVTEEDGDIKLGGKDRVVSACIALQAIKQVPFDQYEAVVPEKRPPRFKNLEEKLEWLTNRRNNESYFD